MVHLRVDRGGGYPDLSEPQAFKNVFLQIIVYQTFTYCQVFYKELYYVEVFDV